MSNAGHQDVLATRRIATSQATTNSPLISYALGGLQKCWLPDQRRWSHIYHLDGRAVPNESVAHSDAFHSLTVLLGMSRVPAIPNYIDIPEVFWANVTQLTRLPVAKHAFGLALWAAARLKLNMPFGASKIIRQLLEDRSRWTEFRAQDLGMLLTGIVAQAAVGRTDLVHNAAPLFDFLNESYATESGLFCDRATGYRRRFVRFPAQVFLAIACYSYGELEGDAEAIELANACVRRLIKLQGRHGEWPWLFDAERGEVVDFYEVYSVHQYGMAPALLEFAERHHVEGAREALVRGFNWVFGENQLKRSMLLPSLQMSYRSQVRQSEMHARRGDMIRTIANVCLGRKAGLVPPDKLAARAECRSYELGWILWAFGERNDLPQLTQNLIFSRALR